MEKSINISERVLEKSSLRRQGGWQSRVDRNDHLKVWREIYKNVRLQWAEAEHGRAGRDRLEE